MGVDALMEVRREKGWRECSIDNPRWFFEFVADLNRMYPYGQLWAGLDKGCEIISVEGLGRYPVIRPDLSIRSHVQLAEWIERRFEGADVYYGSDAGDDLYLFDKAKREELLMEEQNDYPPTEQEQKMLDHWAKTVMVELLRKGEPALSSIPLYAYELADGMLEQRRKRVEDY